MQRSGAAAADDAAADRDTRVAASDFSDAAEATAALRDAAVRAALDRRIREHDAALRSERDRLRELELELAGAPEELVELSATAAALADARERWSSTVDAAAHAAQTLGRLRDLLERATQAHAEIARLADEHADRRAPGEHRGRQGSQHPPDDARVVRPRRRARRDRRSGEPAPR